MSQPKADPPLAENTTNSSIRKNKIRVRIAPSPTGIPHIGNTRTALFNYLFAKHKKGKFILRIEDTDRARLVIESEDAIHEILKWLGLDWDEEYKQSERIDIYKKYAAQLLEKGLAYKEEGAIRFKMPKEGETSWDDLIGGKHISFKNNTQEDFVILKSDGFPTYNFANVVDDRLMEISHIIRGEEFISSTPKHIQLYIAFGWKPPFFAHLPVVLGPDRAKLSKRHGAESVLYYREEGYLKEALLSYMATLGWKPTEVATEKGSRIIDDRFEIWTLKFMIDHFNLEDINTGSPIFDIQKLRWMNGEYIRMMTINELAQRLIAWDPCNEDDFADDVFKQLVVLAQTRMNTLKDFDGLTAHFVNEPEIRLNDKEKQTAKSLNEIFIKINTWEKDSIILAMREVLKIQKAKGNVLYKILTGIDHGLPLPESLVILGKEKVLARLAKLARLKEV